MRIGLLTTINSTCMQYITRDLAWGFRAAGHEAEVVHENTKWADFDHFEMTVEQLMRFVDEWRPDVMVQVNGNRFHHPPITGVRWVNWAFDRLPWLYDSDLMAKAWTNCDWTVAAFRPLEDELRLAGHRRIQTLHAGYNGEVYNTQEEPKRDEYSVDIAMVCHIASGMGLKRLGHRYAAIDAALTLAREGRATLGLWGQGWDQFPDTAPYAKGPIENGAPLKALYQQAKLHLHANEDMVVHMRPLECLASGGRVAVFHPQSIRLNRWKYDDLNDLVLPGYEGADDLEAIIKHTYVPPREDIERCSMAHRARAILHMVGRGE